MSNNNRITNTSTNGKNSYFVTNNELSEPKDNTKNLIVTSIEPPTP